MNQAAEQYEERAREILAAHGMPLDKGAIDALVDEQSWASSTGGLRGERLLGGPRTPSSRPGTAAACGRSPLYASHARGSNLPTTLLEAAAALDSGALSSTELTGYVNRRAEELDSILGVYITPMREQALRSAAAADDRARRRCRLGPLDGVPFAVKDNFVTGDAPTTGQSAVPLRLPRRDADVVRSIRDGGAVLTGKTSMGEFAVGIPAPNQHFPLPRNPWDPSRYPGGSSAGSAIGVSASLFFAGLGTDTAGSVRMPAALCGVTGLKPTYGLLSTSGTIPLAAGLDTVGPIARTAADCGVVLSAMCTSVRAKGLSEWVGHRLSGATDPRRSLAGLAIGVDDALLATPDSDPLASMAFGDALSTLSSAGARVMRVEVPLKQDLQDATMVIMKVEAFAQHERLLRAHWDAYGESARLQIIRGAAYSREHHDRAKAVCRRGREEIADLMRTCEVLMVPTMAIGAPPLNAVDWGITRVMFTSVWNGVGLPAIAFPIGFATSGMPLSAQIVGRELDDARVIAVADAFQQLTDWHLAYPQSAPLARRS